MLTTIKKTANKFITLSCPQRGYAAVAGKCKLMLHDNVMDERLIKNHAQYITDFNIIYEDINDIKLYSVGSLHTKPVKNSFQISSTQNYRWDNKPQQLQFHHKYTIIENKLHIIKNSKQYFEDKEIKENVEKLPQYKEMFNNVILELNSKAIKYKIATNKEDFSLTAFNVFLKTYKLDSKNDLLDTLHIPKNDKQI